MRTGNRKPKINKKPSRGLRMRMHQVYKGMKKAMALAAGPTNKKTNWNRPKEARARWLSGFRGGHNAHQGGQEKARRVRQMKEHKCINPECWV